MHLPGAEAEGAEANAELVDRSLKSALDAGINVIDTAECYEQSEELIGKVAFITQSKIMR